MIKMLMNKHSPIPICMHLRKFVLSLSGASLKLWAKSWMHHPFNKLTRACKTCLSLKALIYVLLKIKRRVDIAS